MAQIRRQRPTPRHIAIRANTVIPVVRHYDTTGLLLVLHGFMIPYRQLHFTLQKSYNSAMNLIGSEPTGIYSDTEIIAALKEGHIVCDPAPARINGSSIDVTLGYYFYEAGGQGGSLFNPFR